MKEKQEFNKIWIILAIIWFLVWVLGIHRFIHWKIGTGILMLITFWWFGIWWLIDGIIILSGSFKDEDNNKIEMFIK